MPSEYRIGYMCLLQNVWDGYAVLYAIDSQFIQQLEKERQKANRQQQKSQF